MRKYILLMILVSAIYAGKIDNLKNEYFQGCDIILHNSTYKVCYSYTEKSMLAGFSVLTDKVNTINIKKRNSFRIDYRIPKQYRTKSSDYTNTGFDRGHTAISDASSDYSIQTLKESYLMSNITLQRPNTNRRTWLKIEKLSRDLTKQGTVKSLTLVLFGIVPDVIKGISIPKGYIKVIEVQNKDRCFYVPNDNTSYTLKQVEFNCKYIN